MTMDPFSDTGTLVSYVVNAADITRLGVSTRLFLHLIIITRYHRSRTYTRTFGAMAETCIITHNSSQQNKKSCHRILLLCRHGDALFPAASLLNTCTCKLWVVSIQSHLQMRMIGSLSTALLLCRLFAATFCQGKTEARRSSLTFPKTVGTRKRPLRVSRLYPWTTISVYLPTT